MKKLLLFATLLLAVAFSAQTQVATYQASYWPDRAEYKIEVSDKNGEIDRVWIDTRTLDRVSTQAYLLIDAKKMPDFISFLQFSKTKYDEWSQTAKANNVTELNKVIEHEKRFNTGAAFKYGKWQFDNSNNITSKFLIIEGKKLLVISTGELQSTSNQFMKNDGIVLIFSESAEIQDFINKLDLAKLTEAIKTKDQKQDLFK